jgi:tRNA 2-thiouridine synthesizing protein E
VPTLDHHGISVQTDEDGFLLNGNQWTPEIAELLAGEAGIAPLTDKHWQVIAHCREDAARSGHAPDCGRISKLSGLRMDELERLFPGDPKYLIARIAGMPRPGTEGAAGGEQQETRK